MAGKMDRVSVWIDEGVQDGELGPLPESVDVHTIQSDAPLPQEIDEAELLVPSSASPGVLDIVSEMPRLSVVQVVSAGVDWLSGRLPETVTLCNARGTRDDAVAEWAVAAMLAMEKRLPAFGRHQAEHEWTHEDAGEVAGKRALIVGFGSIGRCLARKLEALGIETTGLASRPRDGVHGVQELPELLEGADYVIVLAPLTDQTRGLFDASMLARMRDGALLVNAARGPVVETDALVEQLRAGRIRAALDVTDPEPLPPEHPLWGIPEVLITPHMAGDSPEAARRAYRLVGEQIRRYARGEPLLNVVQGPPTPERPAVPVGGGAPR